MKKKFILDKLETKTKKKIIIILSVILCLLIALLIGGNLFVDSFLNKLDKKDSISDKDAGIDKDTRSESEKEKIVNILLMGIDNDTETHRSDAMKVVSIDLDDHIVTINSLQRDNLVDIPGQRYDKLNHAYQYGGAELAVKTINHNFDLDITQYVSFDFNAVYSIVDILGGVSIWLSDAEAAQVGLLSGGSYILNGEQALAYARIRNIDSDYGRMQRQNNVIQAIVAKFVGSGVTEMLNTVNLVLPYVETNMSNSDIKTYASVMIGFSMDKLHQYQVPENGYDDILESLYLYGYGPHYVLKDFSGMVEQLHHNIYRNKEYKASKTIKKIEKTILKEYATQK